MAKNRKRNKSRGGAKAKRARPPELFLSWLGSVPRMAWVSAGALIGAGALYLMRKTPFARKAIESTTGWASRIEPTASPSAL